MKYIITIFFLLRFSLAVAQKQRDVEIFIDLEEKFNKNEDGKIVIRVKYLDGTNRMDTLNTSDESKSKQILKFSSAKIFLNVKYLDRSAGFCKAINRSGKLKYSVSNLKIKKEIELDFSKDKFAYEGLLYLRLSDLKGFQPGIILNDWKDHWTFSSLELFELSNLYSDNTKSSIQISSNIVETTVWVANDKKKSIMAAKKYADNLVLKNGNMLYLNLKNLNFYFESTPSFQYKYIVDVLKNKQQFTP